MKEVKVEQLREILLDKEIQLVNEINERLDKLESIITEKEKISERITPVIQKELDHYDSELGNKLTKVLDREIRESKDQIVEVLYPILGKLIKKYISNEILLLNQKIAKQTSNIFSFKTFQNLFRSDQEIAADRLAETQKPKLIQVFAIEKYSGILKASYTVKSEKKNINEDMVAGMLTAIKSFVQDAFQSDNQELNQISYDTFTIHIQNFHSYYMAVVLSGNYNLEIKDKVENKILTLVHDVITLEDLNNKNSFTKKIKKYFSDGII